VWLRDLLLNSRGIAYGKPRTGNVTSRGRGHRVDYSGLDIAYVLLAPGNDVERLIFPCASRVS
jgi:hypothetical protein